MQLNVKPIRPVDVVEAAMDDATVALRIERRLKPKQKDNFGMFTSDSILAIYHQATNGIFAVLVGVVALSLRRRRHRHHEHHADGGHRADPRDRPAQGARRQAARHHAADADRVGHAVGGRRHRRHDARASCWRWLIASVRPLPASVQPWSVVARHRHHGDRRPVLRRLPGDARGAGSTRSKPCGRSSHGHAARALHRHHRHGRSTRCARTSCARR